jgi:hypothetical protein
MEQFYLSGTHPPMQVNLIIEVNNMVKTNFPFQPLNRQSGGSSVDID